MAVQRPDRGYAWVVVFSCAFANFALFGLFRSAGVLYVALIHEYGITREEASWPFSLCSAIFQLIGPVASVFVQFTSLRKLALLGSVIATVGVICCYFATSIMWVNIWYGVVHGIGFGMVIICVPVIINQYFIRHRATAMGCSFAGATLSSFVLPPVIECLQQEYGLRGSFLILSGLAMNAIVACSFLRSPPWYQKNQKERAAKPTGETIEDRDSGLSTSETSSCKEPSNDQPNEYDAQASYKNDEGISEVYETLLNPNDDRKNVSEIPTSQEATNPMDDHPMYDSKKERDLEKDEMLARKEMQIEILPRQKAASKERNKWSIIASSILETVSHPMFYVLTLSAIVFFLVSFTLFIVIVDFAKDKGIPEVDGIYLLPVFSLTDLVGRVAFGWITDSNYVSRKKMFIADMTSIGILCWCYPHCYHFVSFSVVMVFHGIAMGSGITLIYVLQAEYLGLENQIYFCGIGGFIGGFTTLSRPPLIGLFRDHIGSYDWMFRCFGSLSLMVAIVWMFEPCINRRSKQRKKCLENVESDVLKANG